jgi:hypothetical protein
VRLGIVPPWYLVTASGAICLDEETKITQHYEQSSLVEHLRNALAVGSVTGEFRSRAPTARMYEG